MLTRLSKLLALVRTVRNWPRALADHLRLTSSDYVCELRNGLRFHVRGGTDDRHVIFEVFAERIYPVDVPRGGVVIDVGAQIGCFTMFAVQQGARVFSFEPVPANFEALQRNLDLNRATGAQPARAAVTGTAETRTLFLPDNAGYTGRFSLHPGRGAQTIEVPCISLDEVVRQHKLEQIDLVKIDCQGSEYEILYGTGRNTFERIRAIVVECEVFETPADWSIAGLKRFLDDRGFTTVQQKNILFASQPARTAV